MAGVDLHIHSTASDGRLTPEEIVHKSMAAGVAVIALADHDTVAGVAPALSAAKAFPWLKVIPCVEVSTDVPQGEVHVLGYFIEYASPELQAKLASMRDSRRDRAQKMVAKLDGLGLHISWSRVQEIAGGSSIGRPHVAQALLEKGYIATIKEAFAKYIGRDGPAYVERVKMTPQQVIEMICQAGGLPVLAHPLTVPALETMVIELKAAGLVGIEAYYNGYTQNEINGLVSLAVRHGLVTTGGSDYHGLDGTETMIGNVDVPVSSVEQLFALAGQWHGD